MKFSLHVLRAFDGTSHSSTGWELPHNIPYEAKTRLIKEFVSLWTCPSRSCFNEIQNLLNEVVEENTRGCFGQFPILQARVTCVYLADVFQIRFLVNVFCMAVSSCGIR